MLITYLITVYNKENYISHVIDSVKAAIKENFRKELIIIDDGSSDNSLALIKKCSADIPKTLVITQENQGPAISINKGINLARGDYIHFVDGDDIINPEATKLLLRACRDLGTEVAYGLRGQYDTSSSLFLSKHEASETISIDDPTKAILLGKMPRIRSIGSSGSLVSRHLLKEVSGADPSVFVQDLSLSLRCSKYSKFAFLPKTVTYSPTSYDNNHLSHNKEFEAWNTLKAINNFMEANEDIAKSLRVELYRVLWSTVWKLNKMSPTALPRYLLAKYINKNIEYKDLLSLYKEHIRKLL